MLTASPAPNLVFSTSSVPVGPSKRLVAQTALLHLLSTNPNLFSTFVDQCYAADPSVSRAYFQVPAQLSCTHKLLHTSVLRCVKRHHVSVVTSVFIRHERVPYGRYRQASYLCPSQKHSENLMPVRQLVNQGMNWCSVSTKAQVRPIRSQYSSS